MFMWEKAAQLIPESNQIILNPVQLGSHILLLVLSIEVMGFCSLRSQALYPEKPVVIPGWEVLD